MRGLLGKELRVLAPFTLLLIGLQLLIWIALRSTIGPSRASDAGVHSLIFILVGGLFGALFFGLEPPAVRGFLLGLPISRGRILATKVVAAVLHISLFWVGTEGVVVLIGSPSLISANDVLMVALMYGLCAFLSTVLREALTAMLGGFLIVFGGFLLFMSSEGLRQVAPVWGLAGLVLIGLSLWHRMATLEDQADDMAGGWTFGPSNVLGSHLAGVEWSQKHGLALLLLGLPALAAVWPWDGTDTGGLLAFFWAPLAGAVLGAAFFTAAERDGSAFFLHHLPISRRGLVLRRLFFNLAFGAVLLSELVGIVVWLIHPVLRELGPPIYLIVTLFLAAFGLGAMLSPWFSSSLVSAVLTILTMLALALIPGLFGFEEIVLSRYLVLLVAVFVMAWWSTVHSQALEPSKGLQAFWLLLPFWVAASVLRLVLSS